MNARSWGASRGWLLLIVALLIVQFELREYHITLQGAYLDEGSHSMRGALAWRLDTNPGRFSNGKLLLYYYIGLFEAQNTTSLFVSRSAVALFSLVSGAVIYCIGRWLHSRLAGILGLICYGLLPFAVFHESMVLADPFAAAFACLVAWRSLVFARHPRWREGIVLGVLLTLSIMAKLTLGLLPVLPVAATLIYFPKVPGGLIEQGRWWLRHYFPPLALAAVIVVALWLPILIPAYQAYGTPNQFVLLDLSNVAFAQQNASNSLAYTLATLRDTAQFTGVGFYVAVVLAVIYLFVRRKFLNTTFFLLYWIAATAFLTFGFASIVSARYLIPSAAPAILIVTIAFAELWNYRRWKILIRATLVGAAGLWIVTFAIPFFYVGATHPARLPLTGANYELFLGGTFNADKTTLQVARVLNNTDPLIETASPVKVIYGDWVLCHILYFYVQQPMTCLLEQTYKQQLADFTRADLASGESAYLVMLDSGPSPVGIPGVCPTLFAKFTRAHVFPINMWRLQREPCN